ncbi:hypothetical protein RDI58_013415 [Solanum bulbocastanum]|uniref:Uncharacterized protein n=1 Tax=Solanum bulbocastanum TaxID=147425 RepID=A0AAN8TM49_SOLBU
MGSSAHSLPYPNIKVLRYDPCLFFHQKCDRITEVSEHEMYTTIKGMPLDKTAWVDGFPVEFFTQHWSLIKIDVICVVMVFFQARKMLKAFSRTAITLVPKVSTPTQVK